MLLILIFILIMEIKNLSFSVRYVIILLVIILKILKINHFYVVLIAIILFISGKELLKLQFINVEMITAPNTLRNIAN
jgi:hypothetical protein